MSPPRGRACERVGWLALAARQRGSGGCFGDRRQRPLNSRGQQHKNFQHMQKGKAKRPMRTPCRRATCPGRQRRRAELSSGHLDHAGGDPSTLWRSRVAQGRVDTMLAGTSVLPGSTVTSADKYEPNRMPNLDGRAGSGLAHAANEASRRPRWRVGSAPFRRRPHAAAAFLFASATQTNPRANTKKSTISHSRPARQGYIRLAPGPDIPLSWDSLAKRASSCSAVSDRGGVPEAGL